MVYDGIAMDQDIAKCHDLTQIRNARCQQWVGLGKLIKRLSNHLELSLDGRVNERRGDVTFQLLAFNELLDSLRRIPRIPKPCPGVTLHRPARASC